MMADLSVWTGNMKWLVKYCAGDKLWLVEVRIAGSRLLAPVIGCNRPCDWGLNFKPMGMGFIINICYCEFFLGNEWRWFKRIWGMLGFFGDENLG